MADVPSLTDFTPVTRLDNGHWSFPEQMGQGYIGFLYAIYDNYLKRVYVGKKSFKERVEGRVQDSDWRKYSSSSSTMKQILKARPRGEFDFICLEQYKSAGALGYAETWTLCQLEAPTRPEVYNTRIEKVSWTVKEAISTRHKSSLGAIMMKMNIYGVA